MIKIEITITMGEDSKVMSLEEAQMLHSELGKMFGGRQAKAQPRPNQYPVPEPKTEKEKLVGNHPSVEMAKEKARARTSGCGAR